MKNTATKQLKILLSLSFIALLFFQSCIKDDFIDDQVEPILEITNALDSIAVLSNYQLEYRFLNDVGQAESIEVIWSSSDATILEVSNIGLLDAKELGSATITIEVMYKGSTIQEKVEISVGQSTIEMEEETITGEIITTSSYTLKGSFEMSETLDGILLDINDDYEASSSLPGLFIYLSNNNNSITDALEISQVQVFNGAHSYNIDNVNLGDYNFIVYFCKPFNVKVGEATL